MKVLKKYGFQDLCCSKKSPESHHARMTNLQRSTDLFHKAVSKYIQYCTEHLPKIAKYNFLQNHKCDFEITDTSNINQWAVIWMFCPMAIDSDDDEASVDYNGIPEGYSTSDTPALTDNE